MSTSDFDVAILLLACPPSIVFVVVYGCVQPWFRSWWGWALFTSSTSLSALLSVSLFYRLSNWSFLSRDGWLRTAVYGFIALGCWLTLIALLVVLRKARRELLKGPR